MIDFTLVSMFVVGICIPPKATTSG